MKILLLTSIFFLIGCGNYGKTSLEDIQADRSLKVYDTIKYKTAEPDKGNQSNIRIDFDFAHSLLGKNIEQLHKLNFINDVVLLDTLFESEDESTWPGIILLHKSKKIFMIETSWINTKKIQRVSILSDEIITPDSIKVGDQFKTIKSGLKKTIPSMPDGYFALFGKHASNILYFFDISNEIELKEKMIEYDQIPENLKVSEILLEIK